MNRTHLALLRQKISRHPKLDDEDKAELLSLLPEAAAAGEQPVEPVPAAAAEHDLGKEIADVGRELQHAVRQFEARHPQFTELTDKVLHFLARMGI